MNDLFAPLDPNDPDTSLQMLPLALATRRRLPGGGQEVGDGSVIPRARLAAASVPANPVDQPRAYRVLTADYDRDIENYQKEIAKLQETPDYGPLREQLRARGQQGVEMMAASMAAGMGPRDMRGMQSPLAQMSAGLLAPQKIEGGEIDVGGNVRVDPAFQRQKRIEGLRDDIATLEKMKLAATTAEEKMQAEELQREALRQFREAQLNMQREAAQARAENQRALIDMRRAAAAERTAAKAEAQNAPLSAKDRYTVEDRMSDDFRNETKEHRSELDATRKIAALPTDRELNATEQGAAIYLLNKFLDPGSVVREGEYDRAAKSMGLYERAQVNLAKLAKGGVINPRVVGEIRQIAELYEKAANARINTIAANYVEKAQRRGLDARNVVGVYGSKPPSAADRAQAALDAEK